MQCESHDSVTVIHKPSRNTYQVNVVDDVRSCTCNELIAWAGIPCRHIFATLAKIKPDDLYSTKSISKRWSRVDESHCMLPVSLAPNSLLPELKGVEDPPDTDDNDNNADDGEKNERLHVKMLLTMKMMKTMVYLMFFKVCKYALLPMC